MANLEDPEGKALQRVRGAGKAERVAKAREKQRLVEERAMQVAEERKQWLSSVPFVLQKIEHVSDPRLKENYVCRDPELVKRKGLFIAESPLVVTTLVTRSRFKASSVLLSESRLEAFRDTLMQLPQGTPVYAAPPPVMDEVAGFKAHRSALAVAEIGPELDAETCVKNLVEDGGPKTVVVLEGVCNHDNIGSIFRNAAGTACSQSLHPPPGFGVDLVLLDKASADPLYRKAIRTSVGASLTVPYARVPTYADAFALLGRHGFLTWALTPRPSATNIRHAAARLPASRRLALCLGAEGPGMSDASIADSNLAVRIAMAPGPDALNVAAASAIAMYVVCGDDGDSDGAVAQQATS